MMCLRRRASVHSVRDRALFFACGDDDYLFILIFRSWKVRAIATPDPATATAAATAAIAAQLLSARVCCAAHSCSPPMGLTGRGLLLPARSYWQLGWRVTSGKFRSGLLPQFQHQAARFIVLCCCAALHTHTGTVEYECAFCARSHSV